MRGPVESLASHGPTSTADNDPWAQCRPRGETPGMAQKLRQNKQK